MREGERKKKVGLAAQLYTSSGYKFCVSPQRWRDIQGTPIERASSGVSAAKVKSAESSRVERQAHTDTISLGAAERGLSVQCVR